MEAKQNFAALNDVEEETFARFCQYLYTGNYDDDDAADDAADAEYDDRINDAESDINMAMTYKEAMIKVHSSNLHA